jgi:hypothetical protein
LLPKLLHVSAHQRRHLQGVQYEPAELLPKLLHVSAHQRRHLQGVQYEPAELLPKLLHVSAHQRHHLQAVQYEPAEVLPNVMKAEWDEGCILCPSPSSFTPVLKLPRRTCAILLLAFSLFALVAALPQCLCSENPYLSIKLYRNYVCYTNITLYTYSMERSPSWEANQSLQLFKQLPAFLWNPDVHYRTHKCPPPVPILSQLNQSPLSLQLPEDPS